MKHPPVRAALLLLHEAQGPCSQRSRHASVPKEKDHGAEGRDHATTAYQGINNSTPHTRRVPYSLQEQRTARSRVPWISSSRRSVYSQWRSLQMGGRNWLAKETEFSCVTTQGGPKTSSPRIISLIEPGSLVRSGTERPFISF
jgi:hypothetical protein